ncbi:hypothetical protein [Methanosphaerula subterraneus]|uniref:hypothetical protein n=1 Tax=Methanosphaerula subterraneus TaxID=3350244 RepID=UPI003F8269C4
MTAISVKRIQPEKMQNTIEDYETAGWTLESSNDRMAIMRQEGGWGSLMGHVVVAIFTIWWTVGIGNLIYALYRHYSGRKEIHIKIDE